MKKMDVLNIAIQSHDDFRKRRIAVILAWGIFTLAVLSLLSLFFYSEPGGLLQPVNLKNHDFIVTARVTILALAFSVAILLLTRTRLPASALGAILVLGTILLLFISDSPHELIGGRSTTLLLFPIFMAAVIIHSSAALILTFLMAIPFVLIPENRMNINVYAWGSLFGLAVVIWVACYVMEKAIQEAQEETYRTNAMLGIASHELRTPLGVILGYASMIRLQCPDEMQPLLNLIETSAQSLNEIVTRLLDQAHIQSGKLKLRKEEVDIVELVQTVSNHIRPLAHEKSLHFSVCMEDSVPRNLKLDPLRVKQILTNLLTNAVKYTDKGSVSLSIDCRLGRDQQILFTVSDTGLGIPRNKIRSVFKPFVQGQSYDTRIYGGVGLGLSIVQELIRLMDGKITVNSTVNVGSTFAVSIPLES